MALAKRKIGFYISNTSTGTQNAWAPGLRSGAVNFVQWQGASSMTLNGIDSTGIQAGTIVIVKNYGGSSNWGFSNMSGSAAVGNKIFSVGALTVSVGTTRGTVSFAYDGTIWQVLEHDMASNFEGSFNSAHWTAQTAGTWTVETGDNETRYRFDGRRVLVQFEVVGTTVAQSGGEPTILRVSTSAFANGSTFSSTHGVFPIRYSDNGTFGTGYGKATGGGTSIDFKKMDDSQWAAATNATSIWANFVLEMS